MSYNTLSAAGGLAPPTASKTKGVVKMPAMSGDAEHSDWEEEELR